VLALVRECHDLFGAADVFAAQRLIFVEQAAILVAEDERVGILPQQAADFAFVFAETRARRRALLGRSCEQMTADVDAQLRERPRQVAERRECDDTRFGCGFRAPRAGAR
jgi:hypothetical protein